MLNYAILIAIIVIGYIAYTGVDVTEEYDSASKVRNIILDDVFDPFAKKFWNRHLNLNLIKL